eukprot:scaffold264861_cov22-Tisochrysis_lutea.AAC.1
MAIVLGAPAPPPGAAMVVEANGGPAGSAQPLRAVLGEALDMAQAKTPVPKQKVSSEYGMREGSHGRSTSQDARAHGRTRLEGVKQVAQMALYKQGARCLGLLWASQVPVPKHVVVGVMFGPKKGLESRFGP